jgi:hypothetical protein
MDYKYLMYITQGLLFRDAQEPWLPSTEFALNVHERLFGWGQFRISLKMVYSPLISFRSRLPLVFLRLREWFLFFYDMRYNDNNKEELP